MSTAVKCACPKCTCSVAEESAIALLAKTDTPTEETITITREEFLQASSSIMKIDDETFSEVVARAKTKLLELREGDAEIEKK